jgi:triosephosphate isomerase
MASRRTLIAGNWKMNGNKAETKKLAGALARKMKKAGRPKFEMLVCPPFPLLGLAVDTVRGSGIKVGAQDCHMNEKGAHTGDTAAPLIKNMGAKYVIVGHSERRTDHGETDKTVKAKAEAAIAQGMAAIVCIGETLAEREAKKTMPVNRKQLKGSLPDGANAKNTVIAYEPVWAIGTGKTATPEDAQKVHAMIRKELIKALGEKEGNKVRVLYGGSMNPKNAAELLAQPDIDGGLIGGASLKADDFWAVAESVGA